MKKFFNLNVFIKYIPMIIAIIFVALFCVWAEQYDNVTMNMGVLKYSFKLKLSLLMVGSFVFGLVMYGLFFSGIFISNLRKGKSIKNKLEQTSINNDKDKAKIQALERKIATLEKALKSKIEE